MTSESRTENGATLDSVFTYDPLGQLTGFTRSDGLSESYAYDPVGNMTAKTQNSVKTAMTYNAANQLIQSVSGTDKTTYSYDANGNLVKSENAGGARSYTYNALGLLAQFTREDGYSESYTYNANKLLSGITNNTGTTALTYDILYGDGVVISSARNGEQTSYTYGLERISAQTGKTRTEYVYDGRGSVAAEVSYNNAWYTFGGGLSKKQITSKSYTPFGEQIGEATSGFGYNGEYYNAASGMIYLRARFYAPEMNRFSQKDILRGSILQPGSLNRYLYVQNDPVNFVDPSGMRQVAGMYGDGTGRTSTTRSSSRTSYTPPSYPAPSGPARSTASSVNPYNTVRATSQAISDARRAADIANSRAPGSPAAYRATQAYYETQRLAAQAMASHNTQAGIKAVQTSQASVNYVNNVVTGRAPNTYSPYDSHGNVYSYYNSSYDTGKIPTPDALTIEEVDADSVYYCEGHSKRIYDREAAVEYANRYSGGMFQGKHSLIEQAVGAFGIIRNNDYPNFGSNCTNFTSQVLEAGGIEQTNDWYAMCYDNTYLWTKSWSVASSQYEYVKKTEFYNGEVEISFSDTSEDDVSAEIFNSVTGKNVQVGDLIYYYHNVDGELAIYHSAVVSKIEDGMIYYSGNSTRWNNKALIDAYQPDLTTKVVIVKIKDEY